jgi:hypothetical protein
MSSNSPPPEKGSTAPPHLPPFDNDDDGGGVDLLNKAKRAKKVKESVIDHTYRDYSLVQVDDDNNDDDNDDEDQDPDQRRKEPNTSLNFPAKLHVILSNPSYRHIIRWMVSIY